MIGSLFVIVSIAGGLATSFNLLLTARIVEGIAGGIIFPLSTVVSMRSFSVRAEQSMASGISMAISVLGPAVTTKKKVQSFSNFVEKN